jgi:4-diphosphocytidyl-2-C-methyl-D-erythritol kinase
VVRLLAHAKVNLSLEVLGRRDDGFHELATVLQALSLADELTAGPADTISLDCDEPSLNTADNLVLRAARLLKDAARVSHGAALHLRKQVPVAAGLGGGSADAAATLIALNRLWDVGLAKADLVRLGAALGSDVPFFVGDAGTSLAEGRGELLRPLTPVPHGWVVLLAPDVLVPERKTAKLFGMLTQDAYGDGGRAQRWKQRLLERPSWPDLLRDPGLYNAFQAVAEDAFPGIGRAWRLFQDIVGDASPIAMSGAGPTLFAVLEEEARAIAIHRALRERSLRAYLTETGERPITVLD